MTWSPTLPQGHEQRKTRWRTVPYCRGTGLDLGCGPEKFMDTKHVIGVDSNKDAALFGIQANPNVYADVTDLKIFATGSMDFAFSSHVCEHFPLEQVPSILREWMRVIRVGGHLCLYLPDEDQYPKVGEPHANVDHKFNVNRDVILDAMKKAAVGFDLVEFEKCSQDDEYSLWFVFRKDKNSNKQAESWKIDPNPEKKPTVGIVRFGAFGDTVQAASVCASFKKLGYHVTLYCTYPASEIVAFDPSIDKLVVQLQDQVPMNWLGYMWAFQRKKHDKFVNLTECVEGNFLATAGNIRFEWPPLVRHRVMNFNYLEIQHQLGGVPYEPSFKFHPTAEEAQWAKKEREKMRRAGIEQIVLWALAGSSRTHKLYPHQDSIWKHLFDHYPNAGVVTAGDGSCKDLEAWPHEEPRLWATSGKWNVRQVLTFLDYADVVVGPETGLLSAAAFYPMPKIIFLSHSTVENLTRDWINTTSLWAPGTICPGRGRNEVAACHAMLPDFNGCRRNETHGTAQCVAEILPEWVWLVLQKALVEGSGGTWNPPLLLS